MFKNTLQILAILTMLSGPTPALPQALPANVTAGGMTCSGTGDTAEITSACAVKIAFTPQASLSKVAIKYATNGQSTILANPNTGYYQFSPTAEMGPGLTASDVYFRFSWKKIEPTKGAYNFTPIDDALRNLKKGQRLAIRIMPLNTCCAKDAPIASDVPDYFREADKPDTNPVGAHGWYFNYSTIYTRTKIFVPDWNDELYLSRTEKLLQELAKKYDGDPRINWVEIGHYGNWGEWHTYPIAYPDDPNYAKRTEKPREFLIAPPDSPTNRFRPGTAPNRTRILHAYTNNFKQTRLIALTSAIHEALKIKSYKPIGFRRDSWGHSMHSDLEAYQAKRFTEDDLNLIFSRWKTAPIYAESWGYGHSKELSSTMNVVQQLEFFHTTAVAFAGFFPAAGFSALSQEDQSIFLKAGNHTGFRYAIKSSTVDIQQGLLRLTTNWINEGVAPTYDDWNVSTYLYNPSSNKILGEKTALPINLGDLYNDSDHSVAIAKLVQKGLVQHIQPILNANQNAPQKTVSTDGQINVTKINFQKEKQIELRVIVEDKNKYLNPLKLNNQGINPDGSFTILKIK